MRRCVPLFWLFGSICAACSGTETGNPPASRVTFALVTTDSSVASVTGGTGHVIHRLQFSFESMGLLDCGGREIASVGTRGLVDLVAGSNSISIPSGDYCGVRIDMGAAHASPALHVQGVRSDGTPFSIDDPNRLTLTLTSTASFAAHADEPLVMAFDAALWFGGTYLQDASVTGGQVTIDATSNSAALVPFASQIAADLYRDPNDDGHIDQSEGPPIASGHSAHTP